MRSSQKELVWELCATAGGSGSDSAPNPTVSVGFWRALKSIEDGMTKICLQYHGYHGHTHVQSFVSFLLPSIVDKAPLLNPASPYPERFRQKLRAG